MGKHSAPGPQEKRFAAYMDGLAQAAGHGMRLLISDDHAGMKAARQAVDKYTQRAPKLRAWMESNVAESFTVFAFPKTYRRRLRTSSLMERISKEWKRRTRVATLFQTRPRYFVWSAPY